jgi:hypothetical protein
MLSYVTETVDIAVIIAANASIINQPVYGWFLGVRPDELPPSGKTIGGLSLRKRAGHKTSIPASITAVVYSGTQIDFQPWIYDSGILVPYRPVKATPYSRVTIIREPELEFGELVAKWQQEKGATSSITETAMCDAYLQIIAMGRATAVPLILAQLRSEGDQPDQWFWALQILTGVDPVAEEDRGDFIKMSRAWLAWGEAEGYVW